ncbi:MAG: isoleucine--tRNA ligase, partial [Candidatus Peregrinibacteria bacterium]
MFKPVDPKQSFPKLEEGLIRFWKKNKTFEKSLEKPGGKTNPKEYVFYDGPPFATGLPHYGHLIGGMLKDVVPRYWTMQGYRVPRVWGWDCHGLPIENLIEKELGLKTKKDIRKFGVDKFNETCRSSVLKYAKEWERTVERMGRWVDMKNAYRTMDMSFMESIWWVFKELHKKGMVYEGRKAMHICPRCETPLSNFEVTLGYKEVKDLSAIWKFRVKNQKNTYLLSWTTAPWSTPSTMGLSVGPNFTYVKAKVGDEFVIYAKECQGLVMKNLEAYEVVEEFKGSKLVGLEYEPIVDDFKRVPEVASNKNVYHVFAADYVEVTEGTGIVTINGSYGEIDMEVAQKNGLPIVMDVGIDGRFTKLLPDYKGMPTKEAARKLVENLGEKGLVWRSEPFSHSYPHCWRCDTPLLNYATTAWFVRVTQIKDQLLKTNEAIHWVPDHVKVGRFGKWLENAKDWAVSRARYWGTPLPIWRNTEDPSDVLVIGSVEELEKLSGKKVKDLHKHIVDTVEIKQDGKTYRRIEEVFDCWFESGSMPYGQWHYPFENKKKLEENFPANFIAEGLDQTRGWFYTLHVLSNALFKKPAFQNVIVNGIVLAENGQKMSKRLKNYPDPHEVLEKYGADALRFYLLNSQAVVAGDLRFSERGVEHVLKNMMIPIWNAYNFFVTYASIDGWTPERLVKNSPHKLDTWIMAELNQLISGQIEYFRVY